MESGGYVKGEDWKGEEGSRKVVEGSLRQSMVKEM